MATKKDRKTVRRDGASTNSAESHKMADLESCQRLLELGGIGARTYNGPNVAVLLGSRHDRLLHEMKWVAVDLYENRKLAIAHCRSISGMVKKYWTEKSRGTLSNAAPMVQAYWMSVAKEIRAPIPTSVRSSPLFKLNTLQSIRPSGSPRATSALSAPTSLLPTPTAAAITPNGLMTPTPEDSSIVGPDKKALAHGLVHDWLIERVEENPPLAEGTTGLADFSVQIVKHHLREDHTPRSNHGTSNPVDPPQVAISVDPGYQDYLVPIDSFAPVEESLGSQAVYKRATKGAIEWAVEQNMTKRGADCLRCDTGLVKFTANVPYSNVLVSSSSLEAQRTLLTEVVATNVMSKAPQLFTLTSAMNMEATPGRKAPIVDRRTRENEVPPPNGGNGPAISPGPKHYFLSVIFTSATPVQWDASEDALLREATKDMDPSTIDWEFVATTVNWKTRTWTGRDGLRTPSQCKERFDQLPASEAVPVDQSRRKKVAALTQSSMFVPVYLGRTQRERVWKITTKHASAPANVEETIDVPSPFVVSRSQGPCPPARANAFERRGVFAVSKPPTNYFAKAFFHYPFLTRSTVTARGSTCTNRTVMTYSVETSMVDQALMVPDSSLTLMGTMHPNPVVEEAKHESDETWNAIISKIATERAKTEAPKRAFSVEEMVRKNTAAVPGNVPQYISGQMVCPTHPSFGNMNRIAEMTMNRLIGSVVENAANQPTIQQVPVNLDTLFHYCSLFRKKYPAVFVSQHKINKPAMPAPRTLGGNNPAKAPVRPQMPMSRPQPTPAPATLTAQRSLPPTATPTPPEPVSAPSSVMNSASANWLRSSHRQKRGSGANSKAPPSPGIEEASTPPQQQSESAFMVAGGPSLYGQFNHRNKQNR